MASVQVRLKVLLRERHWQTYRTFQREYDRAARALDAELVSTWPSRAQLGRWLSGGLKGLPYPDHCRVLEKMFPGWTAEQLFQLCAEGDTSSDLGGLIDVIEDQLDAPYSEDADWGPAVRKSPSSAGPLAMPPSDTASGAQLIWRSLLELKQLRRMTDEETRQLAGLAGCIVELNRSLEISIASDGAADLYYSFDLLNLDTKPLTRVTRELWFEEMSGPLAVTPMAGEGRRVTIHRIHDTPNLAKFAFQVNPPLQCGEMAHVGYSCRNGRFGVNHYWREEISRHTRRYTLRVRQANVKLVSCGAVEEYPDGAEISANDSLMWDYSESGIALSLARDYLRPKQTVTLRWEVIRESSR